MSNEQRNYVNWPEFDAHFDKVVKVCCSMRDTKGKEYAHSTDRFANFNRAAERLGISREMVLNVYLHKHLDAIDSFILNNKEYSGEGIQGRIRDAITYLLLLDGMIEENKLNVLGAIGKPTELDEKDPADNYYKTTNTGFTCTETKGHTGKHVSHSINDTALHSCD